MRTNLPGLCPNSSIVRALEDCEYEYCFKDNQFF